MAIHMDFRDPTFIKAVAELPFYGQAEQIIRSVNPLWKAELDEPRVWDVRIERGCGCNCPHCDETDKKTLHIEALTAELAEAAIPAEYDSWEVYDVRLPSVPSIVPDAFYDQFRAPNPTPDPNTPHTKGGL